LTIRNDVTTTIAAAVTIRHWTWTRVALIARGDYASGGKFKQCHNTIDSVSASIVDVARRLAAARGLGIKGYAIYNNFEKYLILYIKNILNF